jgi:hypothetical protein
MISINIIRKAKSEGRICPQCHWIITKKDWHKGFRLCSNCTDANKGVNVKYGHGHYSDEKLDRTGEMP